MCGLENAIRIPFSGVFHISSIRSIRQSNIAKGILYPEKRLVSHFKGLRKLSKDYVFKSRSQDDFGDIPSASLLLRMNREGFAREILQAQDDMSALFGQKANKALTASPTSSKFGQSCKDNKLNADVMKAFQLLRPQSLLDYQENAQIGLQARLNKLTFPSSPLALNSSVQTTSTSQIPPSITSTTFEPLSMNLPIINPKAFVLAVDAVCDSLSNDIERIGKMLGITNFPEKNDPQRFEGCLARLFGFFRLEKNPEKVERWLARVWPRVEAFLPEEIRELGKDSVERWLIGHMKRVIKNQPQQMQGEKWYDLGRDFLYDDLPLPNDYIDESRFEFPFHQAKEIFTSLLSFFGGRVNEPRMEEMANQFQQLVSDLQKIGLKEWIREDRQQLLKKLPRDRPPQFETTEHDVETARLLLRAAARGKTNLLEFESLDPFRLFYGFNVQSIKDEIEALAPNKYLNDRDIDYYCNVLLASKRISTERPINEHLQRDIDKNGQTQMEKLVNIKKEENRLAGPLEWLEEGDRFVTWRWRKPEGSQLDSSTGKYIRNTDGLNPDLNTSALRIVLLKFQRMRLNGGSTRISYVRILVAVGDGRGFFGTACGFGLSLTRAMRDASIKALRNADFIDHDSSRVLCTPVKGREYTSAVHFFYKKRGLKVKGRYLPLAFLMGFENMKMKFGGKTNWISRHKALRRALEGIQSRRTLANATGQKYALLIAPGDHWVHWPDKWFNPILKDYEKKIQALKRKEYETWNTTKRGQMKDVIPERLNVRENELTKLSALSSWAGIQKRIQSSDFKAFQTEMMGSSTRKFLGPQELMKKSLIGRTVPSV